MSETAHAQVSGERKDSSREKPPDFFLIGVPRSGTTALYHALAQHPGIFAPRFKEACFTCPDLDPGVRRTDTRYIHDPAEYFGLFAAARPDQVVGEGCIYNIYSPEAPGRIRALNDNAMLLVQIRDPLEQMYSNHALKLIMADVDVDFASALEEQARLRATREMPPINMREYDLRDKATIAPGLQRFVDVFGRDRIHVSLYDDFAARPADVLRSVFGFLGVDAGFEPRIDVMVPNRVTRWDGLNRTMASPRVIGAAKRVVPRALHPAARAVAAVVFRNNRRRVRRPTMDANLRDRLRAEFRPEVEHLSVLVGRDLTEVWWGEPRPAAAATSSAGRTRSI